MGNDPSALRVSDSPSMQRIHLARTDSNIAQAGSPPRRDDNVEGDKSVSSANTSFPLSESALPTTFDTSVDLSAADLSHYFPLPPTKVSQRAVVSSNSVRSLFRQSDPSTVLPNGPSMSTSKEPSLHDSLDSIWAPAQSSSIRISAPVSPISPIVGLLIDFSSETMPSTPSFVSAESSFEVTSIPAGYQSGSSSGLDNNVKVGCEELVPGGGTSTEVVHPIPNFGLLDLSPEGGQNSSIIIGDDEPIQLPPVTYADAANIAVKYPELAPKVLHEPLAATPAKTTVNLPDVEEKHHAITPDQSPSAACSEPESEPDFLSAAPKMPAHTAERPNWALAPDEPEDCAPSPRRCDFNDSHNSGRDRNRDRRGSRRRQSRGYERNQSDFNGSREHGSRGGERSTHFEQIQRAPDNAWQCGDGGGDHSQHAPEPGHHERPADNSWAYSDASSDRSAPGRQPDRSRLNDKEDYHNASNGLSRRGRFQDQSGASERSHNPHPPLRGGGEDSYDQSYRLPSRPSLSKIDSFNVHTPVKNDDSAAASEGNEWTRIRDAWAVPAAEKPARPNPVAPQREAPSEGPRELTEAADARGGLPQHPWTAPAQPAQPLNSTPSRSTPSSQSFRLPAVPEVDVYQAALREAANANEWMAPHAPWATVNQSQSQKPQPTNAPPSLYSGEGSPFRGTVSNNAPRNVRSANSGQFVDVRAPSQSSVAALAASRASEVYDRGGLERAERNADVLPDEFNYFLHSDKIDWTGTDPAKVTQNFFSPSQTLGTSTPPPPPVNAPCPRSTQSFDHDQQVSQDDSANFSGGGMTQSGSFVLGTMKTEDYDPLQSDYKRAPPLQWGPPDPGGREFHNEKRGGGFDRWELDGGHRRGGSRSERNFHEDYRGGGSGSTGHRRGDDDSDHGTGRHDDYDSGKGRRDDYDYRGGRRGDDYNGSGRRGVEDQSRTRMNKYGGTGPLPPYSGPSRVTSFGNPNFVPPSLNDY